jgi:hypothetical protein
MEIQTNFSLKTTILLKPAKQFVAVHSTAELTSVLEQNNQRINSSLAEAATCS